MKAVEALRETGAEVALVLTMVDREEGADETFKEAGLPFRSLYKAAEFLETERTSHPFPACGARWRTEPHFFSANSRPAHRSFTIRA